MTICYVNIESGNPRDVVAIEGLRANGVEVLEVTDNTRGWKKFWQIHKKLRALKPYDAIIVGYTGAILVPWIRFITRKKIAYNSLTSLYEGMIVSRKVGSSLSWVSIRWWTIDYIAFFLAHQILVDSEIEKKFLSKTFYLNPQKIFVHFTGVNHKEFYFDPKVEKLKKFTAVFRGRFLPEAGVDIIVRAAKILESENIFIRIIGNGFLEQEINILINQIRPTNLELISEKLSFADLRQKMGECHLSLGQIACHPRLERSVPHKVFESLALKLPYLTGRSTALLEILKENETCFCSVPGDEKDLAQKIITLKNNNRFLEQVAKNGFGLYRSKLTAKELGVSLKFTISQLLN